LKRHTLHALYVPGFQKDPEAVSKTEQIIEELSPKFENQDWTIQASEACYGGEPSCKPISVYGEGLRREVEKLRPDAIIAHSMGVNEVRYALHNLSFHFSGPIVFLEGPNAGAAPWKLWLTGFPLDRACVQDMLKGSDFMKYMNMLESESNNFQILEIHGWLGEWWLSKDIFKKLPSSQLEIFPKVGHCELPTDNEVVKTILEFLNANIERVL